jgi:hypothetical protein
VYFTQISANKQVQSIFQLAVLVMGCEIKICLSFFLYALHQPTLPSYPASRRVSGRPSAPSIFDVTCQEILHLLILLCSWSTKHTAHMISSLKKKWGCTCNACLLSSIQSMFATSVSWSSLPSDLSQLAMLLRSSGAPWEIYNPQSSWSIISRPLFVWSAKVWGNEFGVGPRR